MNPQKAIEILELSSTLLNSLNVRWWLSAGTALGVYRDGFSEDFVKLDTDLDVGVYAYIAEETLAMYEDIRNIFSDFGLVAQYKGNGGWTQLAMSKSGIILDIYFFRDNGDQIVSYTQFGNMVKPKKLIEKMDFLRVNNKSYPVPTPVEEYLEVRFGASWRIPKRKSGPGNMWMEDCANLVKCVNKIE